MSNFTGAEVYQEQFDPKSFLTSYYQFGSENSWDWYLTFVMKHYCEVFTSGKVKGKTLIDIGTGPTIYQLLSACEAFDEITVSDYADQNREEFEKWLKNDPGAFDWSSTVKHVCELEGTRDKWMEKEEKLRRTVKQYLKCDILRRNPVEPVVLPQADCIMSSLCLEVACKNNDDYHSALKNITSMIKSEGHLVLCGVLRCHMYTVGEVTFSSVYLEEKLINEILHEEGYAIERFEVQERIKNPIHDMDAFFLVAQKLK